mgnify:CR=1 FL=1
MKSLVFCTKNPINYQKIIQRLKEFYKSAEGDEHIVSFGKSPKSFYMYLPSLTMDDPIEASDMNEDIPFIPFENPYFTHVDFHLDSIAKKVIELIILDYPELFILDEDEGRFTGEELLNKEFIIEDGSIIIK